MLFHYQPLHKLEFFGGFGQYSQAPSFLVRRQKGRVTGWIAYTLSRAERIFSCGLGPADFDQAHVLNGVRQVRLPWRMMVGLRINVQTGRPYTVLQADLASGSLTGSRNNQRLPTYVQIVITKSITGHVTEQMREHSSSVALDEKRQALAVVKLVPLAKVEPEVEPAATTRSGG